MKPSPLTAAGLFNGRKPNPTDGELFGAIRPLVKRACDPTRTNAPDLDEFKDVLRQAATFIESLLTSTRYTYSGTSSTDGSRCAVDPSEYFHLQVYRERSIPQGSNIASDQAQLADDMDRLNRSHSTIRAASGAHPGYRVSRVSRIYSSDSQADIHDCQYNV